MAITCIPNQAVNFCTPDVVSCGCYDLDWCTAIEQTDTTQFQVELTEATGTNILTTDESTFNTACGTDWVCGADWAIAGNKATYTNTGAATDITLDLTGSLTTGRYYKIQFDITFLGAGLNTLKAGYLGDLLVANSFVNDFDITGTQATQTITKYIYLDANATDDLVFRGDAGSFELENIKLILMSTPDVLIKDDDGNTDYNFTRDKYSHIPVTAVPVTNEGDTIAFQIQDRTGAAVVMVDIFYAPCVYCDTTRAIITIFWGIIGLVNDCYTICLNDLATGSELESNCFDLKTTHDCTHEITFDNDSDHFNLWFGYAGFFGLSTDFTQQLRIEAKLYHPFFESDGDLFTDDGGTALQTYARKATVEILQTEPLPEFLHDALSNAIIHDNFFIDGVEFVKRPGDYSPDWDKNVNVAPVRIEVVRASNSDNQNRRCS